MSKKYKLSLLSLSLLSCLTSCTFTRNAEKSEVKNQDIVFSTEGEKTFKSILKKNSGIDNEGYDFQTYSYSINSNTNLDVSIDLFFNNDSENFINEYLLGSVDTANQEFTITCKQPFGDLATARLYITNNSKVYCDITIRYYPRFIIYAHFGDGIESSYLETESYSFNLRNLNPQDYYVSDFGYQLRKHTTLFVSPNTEGARGPLPQVIKTKRLAVDHYFTDTNNIDISSMNFDPEFEYIEQLESGCKLVIKDWVNDGLDWVNGSSTSSEDRMLSIDNFSSKFELLFGSSIGSACEAELRKSCDNARLTFAINLEEIVLRYPNYRYHEEEVEFITAFDNKWVSFGIELYSTVESQSN